MKATMPATTMMTETSMLDAEQGRRGGDKMILDAISDTHKQVVMEIEKMHKEIGGTLVMDVLLLITVFIIVFYVKDDVVKLQQTLDQIKQMIAVIPPNNGG